MNETVESLWRRLTHSGRKRPSAGYMAILLTLAGAPEPITGSEVSRRCGVEQGNVVVWTRNLDDWGLVKHMEQAGLGRNGGGHPGKLWSLTKMGWRLVGLLALERSGIDQPLVSSASGTSSENARQRLGAVRPTC